MTKEEEWRPIPGHPNYEASSAGVIRRAAPGPGTRPGKVLKDAPRSSKPRCLPYRAVSLWHDGQRKQCAVHRLVTLAFHGEPPTPEHMAAHGDGDHQNCRAENLRWATHAENCEDRRRHREARS